MGRWCGALVLAAVGCMVAPCVHAADGTDPETEAVILVASDAVSDPTYAHAVLVCKPLGAGRHVGFIINRQTATTLASLFPSHAASRAVEETVFYGGPMGRSALTALVRETPRNADGSIEFSEQVHAVLSGEEIDALLERAPNSARYFIGSVIWSPGELALELAHELWDVLPVSADLVFRKDPRNLWEELHDGARLQRASAPRPGFVSGFTPRRVCSAGSRSPGPGSPCPWSPSSPGRPAS